MKKYYISAVIILFSIAACSTKDSSTLQSAADPGTTVQDTDPASADGNLYEDIDVDAYNDFNSLPYGLQRDVSAKALLLAGTIEKIREYNDDSRSIYSSLNSAACLLYNCWKPMVSCVIDGECRSQLMSMGDCVYKGGDEMMLCFIAAFSQPDDKMLDMMSCLGESGCMPEPVPDCAVPTNRSRIAPVTLADLEGDWCVVRGLSTVYDCWSGQRYSFHQTGNTVSTYDYTYYPVDRNLPVFIKCTVTAIPFAPGETAVYPGRFRVNYSAYGMPGVDDWYCLSHPDPDYLLIYYCGASVMDSYVGGIVLSRSPETGVPQNILNDFAAALADAGISDPVSLADFCTPDNSGISY